MQKRVFDDLSKQGAVREWSVRQRLKEADIVLGDPIAQFVADDYKAKDGEVVPALFEEETVLSDRALVEAIALDKLQAEADEIAATYGFAWSEARLSLDYGDFSAFGRIYPERGEPSEEDAARLEAIQNELETLDAGITDVDDEDDHGRLVEACARLEDEAETIERACECYDPEQAARAGVIVTFAQGGPKVHAGLIRPEDQASANTVSTDGDVGSKEKTFAPSRALLEDLGVERAEAIAAAMLDQPDLAQDALLFVIAGRALTNGLPVSGIELQCRQAGRGHSRPDARDATTLQAIEDHHQALDLTWLDQGLSEREQFVAFRALSPGMKGMVATWCLGAMIAPGLAAGPGGDMGDSLVETVAATALPDIRSRWLPTAANYWSRITKGHMIDLLRQFGMDDACQEIQSAKKAVLADYMECLFAKSFVTLSPEQHAAVCAWAPEGMHTTAPVPEDDDEADAAAA